MRISMIGKDSASLIILLDAIREAYLREEANKEQNQRGVHLRQLEDLQQEFKKKLKDKRKIVDQLAKDVGGKSDTVLAKRQESARAELNRMNMELLDLQSQLRRGTLGIRSPGGRQSDPRSCHPAGDHRRSPASRSCRRSYEKDMAGT